MSKGSKQIFPQRKYAVLQWALEKMLNIITYQGNANQNQKVVSPPTHENDYNQKN